jgi:hypothetical protein
VTTGPASRPSTRPENITSPAASPT